ncbi:MAG: bifunctional 4-hydroxy-2-oxoglutarate aldolase/2-dehydro-3-deoxy-phosphogluconate aldolase [Proteobacteria bacterium]|nr:bifunctional 4-hydroxy-2-oxoglutarate aldolase/2-dehydro-3-deoxy-phosphogluconate aldolase [Pseudomonadota bacterium]
MTKTREAIKKLAGFKVVPVVSIQNTDDVDPICEALSSGELPCLEIAFRSEFAVEAIRKASRRGDVFVGAGTVLEVDHVEMAVEAGAEFVFSPGFHPKVVRYCLDNHIPVVPGVATPTDIGMALDHGLDTVKFFPAEAFGGLKTLKAFRGPFGDVQFIPSGGIGEDNLLDYLRLPNVAACSGSWMVKPELVAKGDFDTIRRHCLRTTEILSDL